jgi:hypothetical protein
MILKSLMYGVSHPCHMHLTTCLGTCTSRCLLTMTPPPIQRFKNSDFQGVLKHFAGFLGQSSSLPSNPKMHRSNSPCCLHSHCSQVFSQG